MPAASDELIWADDAVQLATELHIDPRDRSLLYGEGLFETLRCYRGRSFAVAAHRKRLAAGARALGLQAPPSTRRLEGAIVALVAASKLGARDCAVRITLTGGLDGPDGFEGGAVEAGHVFIRVRPVARARTPRALRVALVESHFGRVAPAIKSTSYLGSVLARREAARRGLDEAVLTSGEVLLEGSTSNLFVRIDEGLVTPPTDGRILPGITRSILLREARAMGMVVTERPVSAADLRASREAFLTSAVLEIGALVEVDGVPIASGGVGPWTRHLFRRYRALALETQPE